VGAFLHHRLTDDRLTFSVRWRDTVSDFNLIRLYAVIGWVQGPTVPSLAGPYCVRRIFHHGRRGACLHRLSAISAKVIFMQFITGEVAFSAITDPVRYGPFDPAFSSCS
jgi:hypothetical protein